MIKKKAKALKVGDVVMNLSTIYEFVVEEGDLFIIRGDPYNFCFVRKGKAKEVIRNGKTDLVLKRCPCCNKAGFDDTPLKHFSLFGLK